jgi:predicted ATPase/DNA-binding SARP family transcriptional activator
VFIRLLGEVSVGTDELLAVPPGGRIPSAVLAVLAMDAGRVVPVDRVAAAVWNDPPESARNAVQVAVSRIRKQFGNELIEGSRAGYRLRTAILRVDWFEAEQLLAHAREALDSARHHDALESAEAARLAFTGDPLTGLDSDWALFARERAHTLRLSIEIVRARARMGLNRFDEAVEGIRSETARHPLNEPAHAALIEALAAGGRGAEALDVYDSLRRRLRGDLGIDPSKTLADLFSRILDGEFDRLAEPIRRGEAVVPTRVSLPIAGSPLLGREAQVRYIAGLVASGHRLITLVGPGGVGKTRLAVEVARIVAHGDARPAAFVDLTLARTDAEVTTVLARALETEVDALEATLRGTRTVLVLDNAEHVLTAVCELTVRLLDTPGVDVLVTSRSRLRLRDERAVEVDGIDSTGITSPAIHLLTDRAGLGSDEVEAYSAELVEIAQRLDGAPLMLELVAGALTWHTPAQVLTELGATLDSLTDTSRDRPQRHSSVSLVVGWSVAQASAQAKLGLGALVMIRGTFSESAANAVIAPVVPPGASRQVLAELVDLCLVKRIRQIGEVRFRILEPVRFVATSSSDIEVPAPAVHLAHARYYFAELKRAHGLSSHGSDEYYDLYRTENANIDQALRWSWANSRSLCLEYLDIILFAMVERGQHDEVELWVERAVSSGVGRDAQLARIRVVHLTSLTDRASTQDSLIDSLAETIEPFASAFDNDWHRRWVATRVAALRMRGNYEEALEWTLAFRSSDPRTGNLCRLTAAHINIHMDRWKEAYEAFDLWLAVEPLTTHRLTHVNNLMSFGYVATVVGELERAKWALNQANALAETGDLIVEQVYIAVNRGWLALAMSEYCMALGLVVNAFDLMIGPMDPSVRSEAFVVAGLACWELGESDAAAVISSFLRAQHTTTQLTFDSYGRRAQNRLIDAVSSVRSDGSAGSDPSIAAPVETIIELVRHTATRVAGPEQVTEGSPP